MKAFPTPARQEKNDQDDENGVARVRRAEFFVHHLHRIDHRERTPECLAYRLGNESVVGFAVGFVEVYGEWKTLLNIGNMGLPNSLTSRYDQGASTTAKPMPSEMP